MKTHDPILDKPMGPNRAGAATVRGYLKALLTKVWKEGEGFDGKRPFGNSGWEHELYEAVGDEGGEPSSELDQIITAAIQRL